MARKAIRWTGTRRGRYYFPLARHVHTTVLEVHSPMLDQTCIFCRIIRGEIPAAKVYEDEATIVFRDIAPKAPVHLLAVPKEHYAGIHSIPTDKMRIMVRLSSAVKKVVLQEKLDARGYRLIVNSGEQAGQAVPHLHVHILSGGPMQWPA
jgi:histidine triad (HIT) family protein